MIMSQSASKIYAPSTPSSNLNLEKLNLNDSIDSNYSIDSNDSISTSTVSPLPVLSESRSSSLSISTPEHYDHYSLLHRMKFINNVIKEMEEEKRLGIAKSNKSTEIELLKRCCETMSKELLVNVEELAMLKMEIEMNEEAQEEPKDYKQQQYRKKLKFLFQFNNDLKRMTRKANNLMN